MTTTTNPSAWRSAEEAMKEHAEEILQVPPPRQHNTILARKGATTIIATVEEDGGVYERVSWDAEAIEPLGDAWNSVAELEADGWEHRPYTLPTF